MEKKQPKKQVEKNFVDEYNELFKDVKIMENQRQWETDGDMIEVFSLYEDYPTSINSNDSVIF